MELKKIFSKHEFGAAKEILLTYKLIIFLVAILALLAYVAVMFYLFAWQIDLLSGGAKITAIDQAIYQKVADDFWRREENFAREENKVYENPFR